MTGSEPSRPGTEGPSPTATHCRSAREVVEAYNLTAWNHCDLDLAHELLGQSVIRHGVGATTVLTHDEAVDRIAEHHAMFDSIRFDLKAVIAAADGEHVTIVYDAEIVSKDKTVTTIGSMEVFRVVGGRITEVWNAGHQEGAWV